MKVFISWSGERSKKAAESLKSWLPLVINALEPWISTHDIDQGAGWFGEITNQLAASQFGIFCLTAENLQAPWLLFEAGAIWKGQTSARACAYLLGLSPTDVGGPFAQFQLSEATREDTWRLIQTLNAAQEKGSLSAEHLTQAFDVWWPRLEASLQAVLTQPVSKKPRRSDRELLEEILQLLRQLSARSIPLQHTSDQLQWSQEVLRSLLAQRLQGEQGSEFAPLSKALSEWLREVELDESDCQKRLERAMNTRVKSQRGQTDKLAPSAPQEEAKK